MGKVAVSWLKIVGLALGLAATILSHETATVPINVSAHWHSTSVAHWPKTNINTNPLPDHNPNRSTM